MTKQELTDWVADQTGETKAATARVIDGVITNIERTLRNGGEVNLPPLGKFESRYRSARSARNPQTGERIEIPAHNAPVFKASTHLKEALR